MILYWSDKSLENRSHLVHQTNRVEASALLPSLWNSSNAHVKNTVESRKLWISLTMLSERDMRHEAPVSGSCDTAPTKTINRLKQECIPVGCVPSAAVAVCWGEGGCLCVWGGLCMSRGCLPGGPGRVSAQGMSAWGGVCPRGCLPGGCVCQEGCLPDPLPLWKELQNGVKTLPCSNYVADGNKQLVHF